MEINFEKVAKESVEQALRECELTIGMTLKEAVEKQVPKKPKFFCGDFYCSVCDWDIYEMFKNCPGCGQRIDWKSVEKQ